MKNKKLILAAIALVAVVAVALGLWFGSRPQAAEGAKSFTVTVVHSDGEEKVFNYTSAEEYLGPALVAEKLVSGEQGEFGLYIHYVDEERAIYEEDAAYWSLYVGDEPAAVGVDQTPLTDGGSYRLEYTPA